MESFCPEEFAEVSRTILRPVYPLIAEEVVERLGIRSGVCLDLGAGTTAFSVELARRGDVKVVSLDRSLEILKIGKDMFDPQDKESRVFRVAADVHRLPFRDNIADFVVSRGSVFFWEDIKLAFLEILRVLKPCGRTYIGGGFGSKELKEQVRESLQKRCLKQNKTWKRPWDEGWVKEVQAVLSSLRVEVSMVNDGTGLWFLLKKPSSILP